MNSRQKYNNVQTAEEDFTHGDEDICIVNLLKYINMY